MKHAMTVYFLNIFEDLSGTGYIPLPTCLEMHAIRNVCSWYGRDRENIADGMNIPSGKGNLNIKAVFIYELYVIPDNNLLDFPNEHSIVDSHTKNKR
jgi:hypothetical protein